MELPILFGVRHLSPAGAWHLLRLLEEVRPRLVLVEGPSDLTGLMADLVRPETVPPVAILAYTQETPVRSILYPLAEYSPEYAAIRWAAENGADCRGRRGMRPLPSTPTPPWTGPPGRTATRPSGSGRWSTPPPPAPTARGRTGSAGNSGPSPGRTAPIVTATACGKATCAG